MVIPLNSKADADKGADNRVVSLLFIEFGLKVPFCGIESDGANEVLGLATIGVEGILGAAVKGFALTVTMVFEDRLFQAFKKLAASS